LDLVDLLILALRVVLAALLYLFLFTVMRLAVRSMRAAPVATVVSRPAAAERSSELALMVVEAGGAPGLAVGQIVQVHDGAVLGRANAADIVLADAAVSAEHARLSRVGSAWVVADLGSTNGTRVNDAAIAGQTPLAAGDVLALGNVKLKVRTRQS
jgi:hypothetical protein